MPRHFYLMEVLVKKCLSVFIDESGDFGSYDPQSPYYIVSMVFHDQREHIHKQIDALNTQIYHLGFAEHAIHTGPLVRKESVYKDYTIQERRKLFRAIFNFVRTCPINNLSVIIEKRECSDVVQLKDRVFRRLLDELRMRDVFFRKYDEIVLYYDNGQAELTQILNCAFHAQFPFYSYKKVKPSDYKLFQAADLICTIELIEKKRQTSSMSNSERSFFINGHDFYKDYVKPMRKKRLN